MSSTQQTGMADNLTHEQVTTKIAALPAQMVYDARYALQQVKETIQSPEDILAIVEPLSRAIGWAEALVFAFEKNTQRDAVQALTGNGQFSQRT